MACQGRGQTTCSASDIQHLLSKQIWKWFVFLCVFSFQQLCYFSSWAVSKCVNRAQLCICRCFFSSFQSNLFWQNPNWQSHLVFFIFLHIISFYYYFFYKCTLILDLNLILVWFPHTFFFFNSISLKTHFNAGLHVLLNLDGVLYTLLAFTCCIYFHLTHCLAVWARLLTIHWGSDASQNALE